MQRLAQRPSARCLARIPVSPGDIVDVNLPFFDDPATTKRRPVLVVNVHNDGRFDARGIYSRDRFDRTPIAATRCNGLAHDSFIHAETVTLHPSEVLRRRGIHTGA